MQNQMLETPWDYDRVKTGTVFHSFNFDESEYVANIVFSGPEDPLFIIPRKYFKIEPEIFRTLSYGQREKRTKLLDSGEEVQFQAEGHVISKFARQNWRRNEPELPPLFHFQSSANGDCLLVEPAIISNERERRIYSERFGILDIGSDHNLYPQICSLHHNIAYAAVFKLHTELGGLGRYTLPEDYHPTLRVELVGITRPTLCRTYEYLIEQAPWNGFEVVPFNRHFMPLDLRYLTSLSEPDSKLQNQQMVIVNVEGSGYCPTLPHDKVILPYLQYKYDNLYARDIRLGPGYWISQASLYYSIIHQAFIVYEYEPEPAPDPYKCLPDGSTAILMNVKLNRFNSFYSAPGIFFISDPDNLLHGLVGGLGKTAVDGDEGIIKGDYQYSELEESDVWVQYNFNDASPAKFEIIALGEKIMKKVPEHKPFTSIGIVASDSGQVYCPYICDFDLRLSKRLCRWKLAGAWVEFDGQFREELGYYEITEIRESKRSAMRAVQSLPKYKTIQRANGDYAFEIPFFPNYCSRPFLYNPDVGFVEDPSGKLATFVQVYYQAQPTPVSTEPPVTTWKYNRRTKQNVATIKQPKPLPKLGVPVWCELNKSEDKLTPLRAIGVERPAGVELGRHEDMPSTSAPQLGSRRAFGGWKE